jgi:dynein heavy chain 1, cytosolic
MKNTLAILLESAVSEDVAGTSDMETFVNWATKFPAQIMILATQIKWSMRSDKALGDPDCNALLKQLLSSLDWKLARPKRSSKSFRRIIEKSLNK